MFRKGEVAPGHPRCPAQEEFSAYVSGNCAVRANGLHLLHSLAKPGDCAIGMRETNVCNQWSGSANSVIVLKACHACCTRRSR